MIYRRSSIFFCFCIFFASLFHKFPLFVRKASTFRHFRPISPQMIAKRALLIKSRHISPAPGQLRVRDPVLDRGQAPWALMLTGASVPTCTAPPPRPRRGVPGQLRDGEHTLDRGVTSRGYSRSPPNYQSGWKSPKLTPHPACASSLQIGNNSNYLDRGGPSAPAARAGFSTLTLTTRHGLG